MEAILGVVWLHEHCEAHTIHDFIYYLDGDNYQVYEDAAPDVFPIMHEYGAALKPWVPWFEGAIMAYKGVWEQKQQKQT